jgi:hypothetical protein
MLVRPSLLISRVVRICIHELVSSGHDIKDTFKRQIEEFDLSKEEQAEFFQVLAYHGYSVSQV